MSLGAMPAMASPFGQGADRAWSLAPMHEARAGATCTDLTRSAMGTWWPGNRSGTDTTQDISH
jgi:hypothetical protein